ncbi:DUF1206 domain-containing protein [Daejeonella sp.]|uniref:DUF1206 domain-containing protein n=1 Tax=Daejeonella sp. TaxID=2805397 RepID=UPI003983B369
MTTKTLIPDLDKIARIGLSAKGVVYVLLGVLAFMASFGIDSKSFEDTTKTGVFDFIYEQPAGTIILWGVTAGLVCYVIWRFVQAFTDSENKGKDAKGISVRGRYLFSGLVYGSLAVESVRMLMFHKKNSGDNSQDLTQELLSKPMGQWLVGLVALLFLAVGLYQIWYALSEKYRSHVNKSVTAKYKPILMSSGKIGYIARGVVWLLLSYIFLQAALTANPSEAGDTSKAFSMLLHSNFGPYLLAIIGIGLACYGFFNFIRARYEVFGS